MRLRNCLCVVALAAAGGSAWAAEERDTVVFHALQAAPPGAAMPMMVWGPGTMVAPGALLGGLFPPMLIMHRQAELGLSDQQTEAIKAEMRAFQSGVVDAQWELQSGQSALESLLSGDTIDSGAAAAAIDRVLEAENALKRQHLLMLVRIRNVLESRQVELLQQAMPAAPPAPWTVPLSPAVPPPPS